MPSKEPEFTVSDRRKFTSEGELRPEVEEQRQERSVAKPPAAQPSAVPNPEASTRPVEKTAPPPPSREEQQRQQGEYQESAKTLESELRRGYGDEAIPDYDVTFDRILEPFYLTALMQLGMMPTERGAQAQVDIIGARHTIDTLAFLQEKTKGNLTAEEQDVLENVIYQLRMRYIELTNAIARSAHTKEGEPGGPVGSGGPLKV
jgi:hypothetical protein